MKNILVTLILFFPLGAFAQTEAAVNQSVVEACFAATPAGQFAPVCVGSASGQCQQAAPTGASTIGTTSCNMAESSAWDGILNREYRAVRAAFSQEAGLAEQLLTAQRAWIAFRDAECQLAYDIWEGGTIRDVVASDCVLQMTARRALELRNMRGM